MDSPEQLLSEEQIFANMNMVPPWQAAEEMKKETSFNMKDAIAKDLGFEDAADLFNPVAESTQVAERVTTGDERPVTRLPATVDNDFDSAHKDIEDLMDHGKRALKQLIILAGASDRARDYEVLSTMIKTLADLAKDRLELQKAKNKLKAEEKPGVPTTQNTTNNNIIVGTATDMIELIRQQQERLAYGSESTNE